MSESQRRLNEVNEECALLLTEVVSDHLAFLPTELQERILVAVRERVDLKRAQVDAWKQWRQSE